MVTSEKSLRARFQTIRLKLVPMRFVSPKILSSKSLRDSFLLPLDGSTSSMETISTCSGRRLSPSRWESMSSELEICFVTNVPSDPRKITESTTPSAPQAIHTHNTVLGLSIVAEISGGQPLVLSQPISSGRYGRGGQGQGGMRSYRERTGFWGDKPPLANFTEKRLEETLNLLPGA